MYDQFGVSFKAGTCPPNVVRTMLMLFPYQACIARQIKLEQRMLENASQRTGVGDSKISVSGKPNGPSKSTTRKRAISVTSGSTSKKGGSATL